MRTPRIGLALSGGTAKSVAHVGVIRALAEAGVTVDVVAGTSGGSIVATMFATGMPLETLDAIARSMSWRKLIKLKLTRLGFISSRRIEDFVRETIGDVHFEDLRIPCGVVATNLVTGDKRVFREGPVARAVRASCSIPQVYLPVEIGGEVYVDGGLAEYLPVETARELGADIVVASHLGPIDPTIRRPRHVLQLVMQITGLMARRNYTVSERLADVLVRPDLDRFSSFDFDASGEMIAIGYEAARTALPALEGAVARWRSPWRRLAARIRRRRP